MSRSPWFCPSIRWRVSWRKSIHPLMGEGDRNSRCLVPVMRPVRALIILRDHKHTGTCAGTAGVTEGIIGKDLTRWSDRFELLSSSETCSKPRCKDDERPWVRWYPRLRRHSDWPEATALGCT